MAAGRGDRRQHGGSGSAVELGVVFEELGRALDCGPFLGTLALAATALLASGDADACAEQLFGSRLPPQSACRASRGLTQAPDQRTATS